VQLNNANSKRLPSKKLDACAPRSQNLNVNVSWMIRRPHFALLNTQVPTQGIKKVVAVVGIAQKHENSVARGYCSVLLQCQEGGSLDY